VPETTRTRETRAVPLDSPAVQTRGADGDDGPAPIVFTGHAAVFGQRAWIGPGDYGWWEEVDPGFFAGVLDAAAPLLVNHDPNIVLARGGSTMRLSTDATGLVVDADLDPGDPDAAMWAGRVRRGDVTGMSFSFDVASSRWDVLEDGSELRVLLEAAELYDVSLVTYPAYAGTDAQVRAVRAERDAARPAGAPVPADPEPPAGGPPPGLAVARARLRLSAAYHRLPL